MKYLIITLIMLTGCNQRPQVSERVGVAQGIHRYVDKDNNIVCYIIYSEGISCLPLSKGSNP
jgi:hypothetical protein